MSVPDSFFRKIIIILFHLLVITVPFFFTWVNEELFEFPKMLLTYSFTIFIVGFWVMRMIREKRWIIYRSVFTWPILAFLLSQVMATIFSIHFHTSIFGYYTRWHGSLLSTFAYILLFYAFISNINRRDLPKLMLSLLLAALGVSLYAIPEHFGVSPSCLLISRQFSVQCWVQDVQTRVFATFGQPNWLAAYVVTLLPLSLIATVKASFSSKKIWQSKKSWLYGITSVALLMTLIFTKSRSGMLGFGISIIVLVLGLIWLLYQKQLLRSQLTTRLGGLSAVLLVVIALFGTPFTPSLPELLTAATPTNEAPAADADLQPTSAPVNRLEAGGTDSGEIRKIVWQGALDVWKRYPLFGSGVETFAYSYYQDRPLAHNDVSEWDFLYNKAHNELLNFLATTGIFGLGTYLVMLGWFGIICLKIITQPEPKKTETSSYDLQQQLVALSLLAGVVALSISNFFGFSTVMVSVLMFLFFGWVELIYRQQQPSLIDPKFLPKATAGQQFGMIITALIMFILLTRIIVTWRADYAFATGKSYFKAQYILPGMQQLQQAAALQPQQALFHDELAETYSQLAVALDEQGESTQAAQLAAAAVQEVTLTRRLNPRHLNFYKTQARVFINLSQIDESLLDYALETLYTAIELAPTDPKLRYNLGVILIDQGETEAGQAALIEAVKMKPNYEAARLELGKLYESQGEIDQAVVQYQYIYDHITTNNQFVNEKLAK